MAGNQNIQSAVGSMLGYLYQCRCALSLAINEMVDRPLLSISLERFDDVAFYDQGSPVEVFQLKHHPDRVGNLTDKSVDFWKTLGIWSKAFTDDPDLPRRVKMMLLTTGSAPAGSASSLLRRTSRDEKDAARLLREAASTTTNEAIQSHVLEFLKLSDAEMEALLSAVVILDSYEDIEDIRNRLLKQVRQSAPRGKSEQYLDRLESWWRNVVIRSLTSGSHSIPLTELDAFMEELSESFKRDLLPIDFDHLEVPDEEVFKLDSRTFVKQIRLISGKDDRIMTAMQDYYRAFTQRSKWTRENLVVVDELHKYENALYSEWWRRFCALKENLSDNCDEAEMLEMGRSMYSWADYQADVPIRQLRHRYVCTGSLHMLADELRVGWHPEYKNRLTHVPMEVS